MSDLQEHIHQRLREVETTIQKVPDDELQRLVDSTEQELSGLALVCLRFNASTYPNPPEDPAAKRLNEHFDAKEQLLRIFNDEQFRRGKEKEIQEFLEALSAKHPAFIVDRLWCCFTYRTNEMYASYDANQLERIRAALTQEAERRGLPVGAIKSMTKNEVTEYIDSLRKS